MTLQLSVRKMEGNWHETVSWENIDFQEIDIVKSMTLIHDNTVLSPYISSFLYYNIFPFTPTISSLRTYDNFSLENRAFRYKNQTKAFSETKGFGKSARAV